jgi:uncharacterized protein
VWQQSCQQLYLPRIKDDIAFQHTMTVGAESRDFFGFAQGKEDGRYAGFSFGKRTLLFFDSSLLLIEPVTAAGYAEAQRVVEEATQPTPADSDTTTTGSGAQPEETGTTPYTGTGGTAKASVKKQFYGSIELEAIQAKKQFSDLVDEVILQFTSRPGVKVKIAIEIQADSATGFDDGLQRAVKENCNVLRFKNAEFEDGGK